MASRRERLASFVLLPAGLGAVGILAYFTFRTTLQVERLRQQSVLEATLGLANEKADRLDKRIIEQDNVVFGIAEPPPHPARAGRSRPRSGPAACSCSACAATWSSPSSRPTSSATCTTSPAARA